MKIRYQNSVGIISEAFKYQYIAVFCSYAETPLIVGSGASIINGVLYLDTGKRYARLKLKYRSFQGSLSFGNGYDKKAGDKQVKPHYIKLVQKPVTGKAFNLN